MSNLSFIQRFVAETPALEKKIQVISLVLSSVVSYLFKFGLISQNVLYVCAGLFAGIALLAQFAVKDKVYMGDNIKDPSSFLMALPDILNQIYEIKTAVTSKQAPDVDAIVEKIRELANTQTTGDLSSQPEQPSATSTKQG